MTEGKMTLEEVKAYVEEASEQEEMEYVYTDEPMEVGKTLEEKEEGEKESQALVVKHESRSPAMSASERLDDAIEVIGKLRTYYKKIRQAALGVTQTEDWTLWGDRYRLNESGASKIMSQLGIHEETIEQRRVNETWGYTIYITRRYVPSWNTSASFDAVGSCRSDDAFVASRRVYDKELGRKVTKQIPAEEVDESNVLKAALANCRVNGIISVCGIKTVSVDELNEAPYVEVDAIQAVSFKGGKRGAVSWSPSTKQVGFAKKLGATEADIKGCKTHHDFQALIDRLKGESKDDVDF